MEEPKQQKSEDVAAPEVAAWPKWSEVDRDTMRVLIKHFSPTHAAAVN
jgi:hypothetical protein